jgi:hypothetical protein
MRINAPHLAFGCRPPTASIALCSRRDVVVAKGVQRRDPGPKSPESGECRLTPPSLGIVPVRARQFGRF